MPVTPSYPGVYIEEIPSGVRTIVGVATSVTAFVGFTKRGPAGRPTQIFNFGDFERSFGGLDVDSPLSYSVQQFFLNGGTEGWVVRTAAGAGPAEMQLKSITGGTKVVLKLAAKTAGQWANSLRVVVDRDTVNPDSFFNLTVTEYLVSGAALVPGQVEAFRNLTLNSKAPTYAVDVVNHNSKLVVAERGPGLQIDPLALTGSSAGKSVSGTIALPVEIPAGSFSFGVSLRGDAPVVLSLPSGTLADATAIQSALVTAATIAGIDAKLTLAATGTATEATITLTDNKVTPLTERSSIRVVPGVGQDAAAILRLGVVNGGIETDAIAGLHPLSTGTVGKKLGAIDLSALTATTDREVALSITPTIGATPVAVTATLLVKNEGVSSKEALRARLEAAIQAKALSTPAATAELASATVALIDDRLVVTAGGRASTQIALANVGGDTTASKIGFGATNTESTNIAAFSPVIGTALAQASGQPGADGTPPVLESDILGDYGPKTGMYALRDVDLFNLLVLPDELGTSDAVLAAAMSFCEERRAFLIADLPEGITDLAKAQDWIKAPSTPTSTNAAAYFPRPLIPDPLQGYRPRKMPGAGAVAGLIARTDGTRGLWKAPAGTEAALRGPTSLDVPLTDQEHGTLNPLGLNALRAFPVYGHVVWGARTLVGSDQMASEWKYIPVRRLALNIEETLFRGTKWVVFEPNDEPLWAQIRVSVGSFMHSLFRQGAFQGRAPREAYLVKCDSETTTQADIDRGIVNIVVGFSPLKPAEFVVIKLSQLAGQLEV